MAINTFFLRVAARCNLNCDYCYVFKHRDNSWKKMPATISDIVIDNFSERLREYLFEENINQANIIFHGGEPLFIGKNRLIEISDKIRTMCENYASISFSLQTNGTLIDEKFLDNCAKRGIGISLSLDGPENVHNHHRKYASGSGSFQDVLNAINLLKKYPEIFEGVIGVIDPNFAPDEILSFHDDNDLTNIDLLLPDSTYIDPPMGKEKDHFIYSKWLINAFDSWFSKHQRLHYRTFEHILQGLLGTSSTLDTFGLGKLDYITIETDGSYHTTDIMKVAYENASAIGLTLFDSSISKAINSEKILEYNKLLSWNNIPLKCKHCEFGNICGGGSLPHRYSADNGFSNPSIYCEEMLALFAHARDKLFKEIEKETKRFIKG